MTGKKIISRILIGLAWLLVAGGLMSLLIAANKKKHAQVCTDVIVRIKNPSDKIYIDQVEILDQLETVQGSLINKRIEDIKIATLEEKLRRHQWIRNAELYIDSKNVLHIVVEEREPVARVITRSGHSFYIDESGNKMSLVKSTAVRLPVVTNFTSAIKWSGKDSIVLNGVLEIIDIMKYDSFWSAQIGQIDVVNGNSLEVIPVIGNHTIRLGEPRDIKDKLHNLFLFYKQVLSKTGFYKYAVVDVQFKGQVLGVKGNTSAVDSLQLKKTIQALIKQIQEEASAAAVDMNQQPKDSTSNDKPDNSNPKKASVKPNPTSVKTTLPSKPKVNTEKKEPKAVMKKKSE